MRSAPSVVYPVGRFVWGVRLAWAGFIVSGLGLGWSFWWMQAPLAVLLTGLVTWLVLGLWSLWRGRTEFLDSAGHLVWDGDGWLWQGEDCPGCPVELAVLWDAEAAFLLSMRMACSSGVRHACVWVEARHSPLHWHGFRCAVYCRIQAGHAGHSVIAGRT